MGGGNGKHGNMNLEANRDSLPYSCYQFYISTFKKKLETVSKSFGLFSREFDNCLQKRSLNTQASPTFIYLQMLDN